MFVDLACGLDPTTAANDDNAGEDEHEHEQSLHPTTARTRSGWQAGWQAGWALQEEKSRPDKKSRLRRQVCCFIKSQGFRS